MPRTRPKRLGANSRRGEAGSEPTNEADDMSLGSTREARGWLFTRSQSFLRRHRIEQLSLLGIGCSLGARLPGAAGRLSQCGPARAPTALPRPLDYEVSKRRRWLSMWGIRNLFGGVKNRCSQVSPRSFSRGLVEKVLTLLHSDTGQSRPSE